MLVIRSSLKGLQLRLMLLIRSRLICALRYCSAALNEMISSDRMVGFRLIARRGTITVPSSKGEFNVSGDKIPKNRRPCNDNLRVFRQIASIARNRAEQGRGNYHVGSERGGRDVWWDSSAMIEHGGPSSPTQKVNAHVEQALVQEQATSRQRIRKRES